MTLYCVVFGHPGHMEGNDKSDESVRGLANDIGLLSIIFYFLLVVVGCFCCLLFLLFLFVVFVGCCWFFLLFVVFVVFDKTTKQQPTKQPF